MASKNNNLLLAAGATALSSTAFWFGTGLTPHWWLAWVAALPLLLVAPRLPGWLSFAVTVAAFFIGELNEWRYLSFLPPPIHYALMLIPASVLGFAIVLYRACLRRGAYWQASLAFPALLVAFEFLYSLASPHGTFGSFAYTQMNALPLIQIASVTGLWGVSFSLLFFSSAMAVLLTGACPAGTKRVCAGLAALYLTLVVGFGCWRLHTAPTGPSEMIGLVASDLPENYFGGHAGQDSLGLFQRYLDQVPALAAQGARIVVMPEHTGIFSESPADSNSAVVDSLFSEAAKRNNVFILIGVDHVSPTVAWNQARFYSPDGKLAATYNKHHLLPFPAEESRCAAGTTLAPIPRPDGVWGIAICKDMDFPALSRSYGDEGIGLLLVPAFDFAVDGWLHGRMGILRGVESGFSIARTAVRGRLTLTDNRGRILAEGRSDSAPFATLVAPISVSHEATLYARFGDWFAWLDLLLLLFILISGLRGHPAEPAADPRSAI